MSDDFFDGEDPFFLVDDQLDAGEKPQAVYDWALKRSRKVRDSVLREQWEEALRYILEEFPGQVRASGR